MSIDTSAELGIQVPPEVAELAAREGVEEYLPKVIDMTRRVFPPDSQLDGLMDEDPEIADDRHIVMKVAARLSVAEAVAADREWSHQLFECCPAPLVCVFRIRLRLA